MKNYPLFKCININDLKRRVGARETSMDKVRVIVELSAPMNKIGCSTYLINAKDSLILAAAEFEGGHGPPGYSISLLEQPNCIIKAVKYWCYNNNNIKNTIYQVFPPSFQALE